jgi:DNA-binding IclR family transcriptional regulator
LRSWQIRNAKAFIGRNGIAKLSLRHDAVEPGVTAISAPISGEGKSVVAAISVVGPTYRLEAFGLPKARLLVAESALKITELLRAR